MTYLSSKKHSKARYNSRKKTIELYDDVLQPNVYASGGELWTTVAKTGGNILDSAATGFGKSSATNSTPADVSVSLSLSNLLQLWKNSSTTDLMNLWSNYLPSQGVSWRTLKGSKGSAAGNILSSVVSGAAAGSVGGVWGAAAGGVIGLASGLFGNSAAKKKAKRQAAYANNLNALALNLTLQNMLTNASNILEDMINSERRNITAFGGYLNNGISGPIDYALALNALNNDTLMAQKYNSKMTAMPNSFNGNVPNYLNTGFALGGELSTQGATFTNGLSHIDTGQSHEENPYGGVPMGSDREGTPNFVEEGESIYRDYVFSDRLKVPDIPKSHLKDKKKMTYEKRVLKPYLGMTFSEAAKKAEKTIYGEGGNLNGKQQLLHTNQKDKQDTLDAVLSVLAETLEQLKLEQLMKEIEEALRKMSPEERGALMLLIAAELLLEAILQQLMQEAAMQQLGAQLLLSISPEDLAAMEQQAMQELLMLMQLPPLDEMMAMLLQLAVQQPLMLGYAEGGNLNTGNINILRHGGRTTKTAFDLAVSDFYDKLGGKEVYLEEGKLNIPLLWNKDTSLWDTFSELPFKRIDGTEDLTFSNGEFQINGKDVSEQNLLKINGLVLNLENTAKSTAFNSLQDLQKAYKDKLKEFYKAKNNNVALDEAATRRRFLSQEEASEWLGQLEASSNERDKALAEILRANWDFENGRYTKESDTYRKAVARAHSLEENATILNIAAVVGNNLKFDGKWGIEHIPYLDAVNNSLTGDLYRLNLGDNQYVWIDPSTLEEKMKTLEKEPASKYRNRYTIYDINPTDRHFNIINEGGRYFAVPDDKLFNFNKLDDEAAKKLPKPQSTLGNNVSVDYFAPKFNREEDAKVPPTKGNNGEYPMPGFDYSQLVGAGAGIANALTPVNYNNINPIIARGNQPLLIREERVLQPNLPKYIDHNQLIYLAQKALATTQGNIINSGIDNASSRSASLIAAGNKGLEAIGNALIAGILANNELYNNYYRQSLEAQRANLATQLDAAKANMNAVLSRDNLIAQGYGMKESIDKAKAESLSGNLRDFRDNLYRDYRNRYAAKQLDYYISQVGIQ